MMPGDRASLLHGIGTVERRKRGAMSSEKIVYRQELAGGSGLGPRELILRDGPRAIGDVGLLAAILGRGTASRRVGEMASRLLEGGGLPMLAHLSADSLLATPSFGPAQASRVLAAIELGRRIWCRLRAGEHPIHGPEDVRQICGGYVYAKKEHFLALYLNTRHVVLREELVSIGSLNASIVHPREVFRSAITESAASLILVHNHPSGDPNPSDDDLRITQRLVEAGDLVGIPVIDHVILGDQGYYSFREEGLIARAPSALRFDRPV
jgi:DNA repair protein RadC